MEECPIPCLRSIAIFVKELIIKTYIDKHSQQENLIFQNQRIDSNSLIKKEDFLNDTHEDILTAYIEESIKVSIYRKYALQRSINVLVEQLLELLEHGGVVDGRKTSLQQTLLQSCTFLHEESFQEDEMLKLKYNCGYSVMQKLINAGADINSKDNSGRTALHYATSHHCELPIDLLLKAGAETNAKDGRGNNCIIELATGIFDPSIIGSARTENPEWLLKRMKLCLELLLQNGADINTQGGGRNTALHCLVEEYTEPYIPFLKLFLESHADPTLKNNMGHSILHIAVKTGSENRDRVETVQFILDHCSLNIDEKDKNLQTPLMLAIQEENKTLTNILLSFTNKTVDITLQDRIGITAAHFAAMTTNTSVLETLLKSDEYREIEDYNGAMPYVYAVASGNEDALHLFRKELQDLSIVKKQFLLKVANVNEQKKTLEYLQSLFSCKWTDKDTCSVHQITERKVKRYTRLEEVDRWIKSTSSLKEKHSGKERIECIPFLQNYLNIQLLQQKENEAILNEMNELIHRIASTVKDGNSFLSFIPILSGSTSEGTKVGVLDELDYLCHLYQVTTRFDITAIRNEGTPGFVKLKCKKKRSCEVLSDEFMLNYIQTGDYLSANAIGTIFLNTICDVLSHSELWDGLHFSLGTEIVGGRILTIPLFWTGEIYKYKSLSIDIVPTILLKENSHLGMGNFDKLASVLNLNTYSETTIVAKSPRGLDIRESDILWRISFSKQETEIFQSVPEAFRIGYTLAKMIRSVRICPLIYFDEHSTVYDEASAYMSSYLLKTTMFHEIIEGFFEKEYYKTKMNKIEPTEWALRILTRLENAIVLNMVVPHFFLPNVNVGDEQFLKHISAVCKIGKAWLIEPWEDIL